MLSRAKIKPTALPLLHSKERLLGCPHQQLPPSAQVQSVRPQSQERSKPVLPVSPRLPRPPRLLLLAWLRATRQSRRLLLDPPRVLQAQVSPFSVMGCPFADSHRSQPCVSCQQHTANQDALRNAPPCIQPPPALCSLRDARYQLHLQSQPPPPAQLSLRAH